MKTKGDVLIFHEGKLKRKLDEIRDAYQSMDLDIISSKAGKLQAWLDAVLEEANACEAKKTKKI